MHYCRFNLINWRAKRTVHKVDGQLLKHIDEISFLFSMYNGLLYVFIVSVQSFEGGAVGIMQYLYISTKTKDLVFFLRFLSMWFGKDTRIADVSQTEIERAFNACRRSIKR